jgi:tRNA threonylcarbamoyladenosine biosynthesis protein TsaB
MLTAALNSAMRQTMAAILENGKVLAEKSWPAQKDEAEKIIPALQRLLKKHKRALRDVNEVFVVNGPGPFTGLRVGVTVANALAWSTGSRIKTATAFEYLRATIPKRLQQKTAIVIKAGGEYVAVMLPKSKKAKLVKTAELVKVLTKAKIRHILPEMKAPDIRKLQKMLKTEKNAARAFAPAPARTPARTSPPAPAPAPIQILNARQLLPFGKVLPGLIKKSKKSHGTVQPLYLQKPYITASKKPKFA